MKHYRTVTVSPEDAEECLALSIAAGWNQTLQDWRLLLNAGTAAGVRDTAGVLVGSIATLHYDPVDWHAMLLVSPGHQGQGIGTRLFRDAVARSDAAGRPSGLDATPAGKPIYEKAGFEPVADLARIETELGAGGAVDPVADSPPARSMANAAAVARWAGEEMLLLGFRRTTVLAGIAERGIAITEEPTTGAEVRPGNNAGFAVVRIGRLGWQLGPLYSPSVVRAEEALARCIQEIRRHPALTAPGQATPPLRLFVDVPVTTSHDSGGKVPDWLTGWHFRPQRPFTRMVRSAPGQNFDTERLSPTRQVFAVAGPEFG